MKRLLNSRKVSPVFVHYHNTVNCSPFQPPRRSITCLLCRTARPGGAALPATPSLSSITRRSGVMLTSEIIIISWCQKEAEPDHLLLVTRTRTDARGRRHSVAVPMLPPPDGEKFAGGYSIQRNPITGGARLLPPPAPGQWEITFRIRELELYTRFCWYHVV